MANSAARHVSETLRAFSTSVGTMGSAANLDSMIQNAAKTTKDKMIGVTGILGEARLNNRRKIDIA